MTAVILSSIELQDARFGTANCLSILLSDALAGSVLAFHRCLGYKKEHASPISQSRKQAL